MSTLFVSDMDGTLLAPDAALTAFTSETLSQLIKSGLNFTVATARSPASVVRILAGLPVSLPVILMNGVMVYDIREKKAVRLFSIPPEQAERINGILDNMGRSAFLYRFAGNELFTYYSDLPNDYMRSFHASRVKYYGKRFYHTASLSDVPRDDIIYFTLMDSYAELLPVYEQIKCLEGIKAEFYPETQYGDYWYLEIFNAEASKKSGVDFLRAFYGFDSVCGFGDNLNDLSLFEACDIKCAVANAKAELKNTADYIIRSNTDDGVARWLLERYSHTLKGEQDIF